MEMHQVRYFLAVARERNFTRAAEQCHVTQPSLTRAIQKLEEEFGGQMFRRERALTHLTDLGRLMHPLLERSFEAVLVGDLDAVIAPAGAAGRAHGFRPACYAVFRLGWRRSRALVRAYPPTA
jgi:DNA-binding transcriptional LysR family regulator